MQCAADCEEEHQFSDRQQKKAPHRNSEIGALSASSTPSVSPVRAWQTGTSMLTARSPTPTSVNTQSVPPQ
eukprot:2477735-Rhodomonas_salina.1